MNPDLIISDWKQKSLKASRSLNLISDVLINQVLLALADEILAQTDYI